MNGELLRMLSDQLLMPELFSRYSPPEQDRVLAFYVDFALSCPGDSLSEVLALAALHPDPRVRKAGIEIARRKRNTEAGQSLIRWAVEDRDEEVALQAIRAAMETCSVQTLEPLLRITGRTVDRIRRGAYIGATVKDFLAATAISQLLNQESAADVIGVLPIPMAASALDLRVDRSNQVEIPAGMLRRGADPGQLPGWFASSVTEEQSTVFVSQFWIDREPVANAQYDKFVADVERSGHLHCHHDEPPSKNHRRSTYGDPRFGPDDPVTGVDWYDAFAFAAWAGKKLPAEDQWEWAARGEEGLIYPWGNEFNPDYVVWAGSTYGRPASSRQEWLQLLETVNASRLERLTLPVAERLQNHSPYGVLGMSGNTWEWTRTRYLDRVEFCPRFGTMEPGESLGDWSAYAAVKGGSWSSAGDLLSPAFRVKNHLLTRSPEIGFRCVGEQGV